MTENTNETQTIDTKQAIELRKNLNTHMLAMIDKALHALEMLTFVNDDVDKKMVEIMGAKHTGIETTPNAIIVQNVRETTDPLFCIDSLWPKDFSTFLSTDLKDPISNGTPGLQFFISIGIRYYCNRIKDNAFFIMSDLPEMLSVDRKMNELISACSALTVMLPTGLTEIKRKHNSRLGKRKEPDERWKKVREALVILNKDPKKKKREWAISAISAEIREKIGGTQNTIIKDFKNHMGDDITSKKESKKNYYISDLINMIDNQ